ncbi:MAG: patatin family protein [Clostridia bacterium]|jgi:predicted patatin/cPLA2 family phospholipase
MIKAALVLEGGALRGMYTSGVLDTFLKNNMEFECVAGVSAGALNAMSYISKQPGRSAKINLEYCDDPRYIGRKAFIKNKGIIGYDYLFGDISENKVPFDYKSFENTNQRFIIVTTNCEKAETEYLEKSNCNDLFKAAQASSSMPLASAMVEINNNHYLDGAVTTSIPVKWALEQGYEKVVVVLTRDKTYRKPMLSNKMKKLYKLAYHKYPKLIEKLNTMPERYNKLQDEIIDLEKEGKIFIIRPEKEVTVSRLEKDKEKLENLYKEGIAETEKNLDALKEYLEIS